MSSTQPNPTPDRSKIVAYLGKAVEEMRVGLIERMISKDATLCMEAVPFMGRNVPFAMACIQQGHLAGAEAALNSGLRIDDKLASSDAPGSPKMTLLEAAVINQDAASVQWLLARKASADPLDNDDEGLDFKEQEPPILRALRDALNSKQPGLSAFRIPLALLDAGADVSPQARLGATSEPAMMLLVKDSWKNREVVMAKMMAILKEKGASVDARSPRTRMSPMQIALGQKNITALCALIDLGAKTVDETTGLDIIERCAAAGFGEEITVVQAAIMRRMAREQALKRTSEPTAQAAGTSASTGADASLAARRDERRRAPQL